MIYAIGAVPTGMALPGICVFPFDNLVGRAALRLQPWESFHRVTKITQVVCKVNWMLPGLSPASHICSSQVRKISQQYLEILMIALSWKLGRVYGHPGDSIEAVKCPAVHRTVPVTQNHPAYQ